MNDMSHPLTPTNFHAQNVSWVFESARLLATLDINNLHRRLHQLVMESMREHRMLHTAIALQGTMTSEQRQEHKRLHHTLQVCVPAARYACALQSNLLAKRHHDQAVFTSAARLATYLLSMVAQSYLFPEVDSQQMLKSPFDQKFPSGLVHTHRSVALDILRDHAGVFAECPAWVEPVVVAPMHRSAADAMLERASSQSNAQRIALRKKIINLGVLTPDEEQLLLRLL